MPRARRDETSTRTRRAPAKSPEERERQLVSLAMDVAEERLRNGKATSQEITHFLKLGTVNAELERAKLDADVRLSIAKVESMESAKRMESVYEKALEAMKAYTGNADPEDYDEY